MLRSELWVCELIKTQGSILMGNINPSEAICCLDENKTNFKNGNENDLLGNFS